VTFSDPSNTETEKREQDRSEGEEERDGQGQGDEHSLKENPKYSTRQQSWDVGVKC